MSQGFTNFANFDRLFYGRGLFGTLPTVVVNSFVLTNVMIDFTHEQLDWEAAIIPGHSILHYQIWRMNGAPNLNPGFDPFTDGTMIFETDGVTLTYIDDTVDETLLQYGYAVRAIGTGLTSLDSNFVQTRAIS